MKNVKLPKVNNIDTFEGIKVSLSTVDESGYCNACTNRNIIKIFITRLRSLEFRLCVDCQIQLMKMLEEII